MRRKKRPAKGDFCLCTRWNDRSPKDPWQIGFIDKVEEVRGEMLYYLVGWGRYWKCCWHVTLEEAQEVMKANNPSVIKLSKEPAVPENRYKNLED